MKCRSEAPGHGTCLKSVSGTITMHSCTIKAIIGPEKHMYYFRSKILTKPIEHEMKVKRIVSCCMLVEYVNDNYRICSFYGICPNKRTPMSFP